MKKIWGLEKVGEGLQRPGRLLKIHLGPRHEVSVEIPGVFVTRWPLGRCTMLLAGAGSSSS